MIFLFLPTFAGLLLIAVMENFHTEDHVAQQILIGCFVGCQSIKNVGIGRSVEELYQALFFVSLFPTECSTSGTKVEPDGRLATC